jgi:hypothetical protein
MQVFTFNPHLIHLFVTTFLTLFLKVFSLQGKDIQCDKSHSCLKPCVGVELPSLSARPTLRASTAVIQNRTAFSTLLLDGKAMLDCGRGLM